jgi:hypothetical protein
MQYISMHATIDEEAGLMFPFSKKKKMRQDQDL